MPETPAGTTVRSSVGHAGPLVSIWAAYLAWFRAAKRRANWLRLGAAAVISITLLLALELREPNGGGSAGETLLTLLDTALGRAAGLAVVSIAAALAVVALIGRERIVLTLALAATLTRRIAAPRERPPSVFHGYVRRRPRALPTHHSASQSFSAPASRKTRCLLGRARRL
jgi:hypothetical protein